MLERIPPMTYDADADINIVQHNTTRHLEEIHLVLLIIPAIRGPISHQFLGQVVDERNKTSRLALVPSPTSTFKVLEGSSLHYKGPSNLGFPSPKLSSNTLRNTKHIEPLKSNTFVIFTYDYVVYDLITMFVKK